MCGIAGFSLSPQDNIQVNSKRLARNLLLGIEHRGPDATGFAYLDTTGSAQVHKRAVTAKDFVKRGLCLDKRAPQAILHTRNWTTGHPSNNDNNHPIASGTLVGVHNGWFTNHNELWGEVVKASRQVAEVDSEVIFAMLAYGYEDSQCSVAQALEAVEGNTALAWLDTETPETLYLARGYGSPLFIGNTKNGSLLFASEGDVVKAAAEKANLELTHLREIKEGTFLTVAEGKVLGVHEFKPQGPAYKSRGYSSYSNMSWDDEAYESWGGRTVTSIGRAKKSAEVFCAAGAEDDGEVNLDWIDRTLFDAKVECPASEQEAYYESYGGREAGVDAWFSNFRGDQEGMMEACSRMKALVRPGQLVTTTIQGVEVNAQVALCPNTFPQGKYVLRCFVEFPRGFDTALVDTETVLVERHYWQFKELPEKVENIYTLTNGEEVH